MSRCGARLPLYLSMVGLFVLLGGSLLAQSRPRWLDSPPRLVYPAAYDATRDYPLIVWLPYTGGTAEEAWSLHRRHLRAEEWFVLLMPGRPQRSDYLPAFERFVDWYEEVLLRALGSLHQRLGREPTALVLAGHSLGGDLAWALAVRNPHRWRGVVLSGTRASHRFQPAALATLQRAGTRFAFFLGQRESVDRRQGLLRAVSSLRSAGIPVRLHEVPDLGHDLPPASQFVRALEWVLSPMPPGLDLLPP